MFSSIPLSDPAVDLDLMEKSDVGLLIISVMDWLSVHGVSLTRAQKAGTILWTSGLEKWMDLLYSALL